MNRSISVILLLAVLCAGSIIAMADTGKNSAAAATVARGSMQLSQILFPTHSRHGRWGRNGSVRYETRTVHKGHKVFEDTYRITYKNGHEKRKRVERVRIR
jgi:hypothetical protein